MSASSLPFEYRSRIVGKAADIVARDDVWNSFSNDSGLSGRGQAKAVMRFYADRGPADLPTSKFVYEERFEAQGRKVRIEAFKGHQTRLYGFVAQVNGRMTFFITGLDLSKKADKAKRRVLDVVGKEAIRVLKALK